MCVFEIKSESVFVCVCARALKEDVGDKHRGRVNAKRTRIFYKCLKFG